MSLDSKICQHKDRYKRNYNSYSLTVPPSLNWMDIYCVLLYQLKDSHSHENCSTMNAFCLVQWAHFIYFSNREERLQKKMVILNSLLDVRLSVFQKSYSVHWKDNSIFHLSFLFLSVKNWNSDSLVNRILVAKGNLKWGRQQFSIIVNTSTLLVEVCSWETKQKPLAFQKSKD